MGSLDAIEALERESEELLCPWCHLHPAITLDKVVYKGDEPVTLVLPCWACALEVFRAVHGDTSAETAE